MTSYEISYEQDLAEARNILATRGNDTDRLLFERAGHFLEHSSETMTTTVNGIPVKRRRLDMVSDRAIGEELAMILSWRLTRTATFWFHTALAARKTERVAKEASA